MVKVRNLKDYRKIVGKAVMDEIYSKAEKFSDKHVVCISSTYQGGGVAELLNNLVFLFDEIGIDFGWRILHGSPDFFGITKKFHNALQGEKINLSDRKKELYCETNRRFSTFTHLCNQHTHHDLVIVHDPQPLPLINFYKKKQPWIFRLHIDVSHPNLEVWNYLKPFIEKYDSLVISKEEYRKNLSIPQNIIYPAIDPLSQKNKFLSEKTVDRILGKYGINDNKPIISQVSRFDKWKDPIGVIKIFEYVRKRVNCQLVLLGSLATDDPEGQVLFKKVEKKAEKSKYKRDIKVILVENEALVNTLQRASSVVIQKSIREGFGLTVSEALFKGTPVVASKVGGIPLQVIDSENGYLHEPEDIKGFGDSVIKLLKDDALRAKFGSKGYLHVKDNFLITRLLLDWLNLFEKYIK
ncbi:MAG: glycosyl transferase family 1 [Candidatus Aenigmatarchaeota archaeon]|nr:MAG: glycosyl transferase family 1 [Candidatus Aenigmarchaeota archaeon]